MMMINIIILEKIQDRLKKDKSIPLKGMKDLIQIFLNARLKYRFYPLNKLTNDGFLNPETDSIQMRFKLQPKSILEERKLFQWQIE